MSHSAPLKAGPLDGPEQADYNLAGSIVARVRVCHGFIGFIANQTTQPGYIVRASKSW